MFCPRCRSDLAVNAPACGHCGFSLATLQHRLGANAAVMDPVMDVAGCLRLTEKTRLTAVVDDFEHRFPQLHLSLFLGILPEMKVLEAGFWLLNHGVRRRREQVCDNRYGIVVVVDPTAHEAGISIGYALEPVLTSDILAAMLRKNSHHLWHADHFAALKSLTGGLDVALRRAGQPRPRSLLQRAAGSVLGLRQESPAKAKTGAPNPAQVK